MSDYKVVKAFIDLKDNNRLYQAGDKYVGSVAKGRIEELTSDKNKRGEILLEAVKPKAKKKGENKTKDQKK